MNQNGRNPLGTGVGGVGQVGQAGSPGQDVAARQGGQVAHQATQQTPQAPTAQPFQPQPAPVDDQQPTAPAAGLPKEAEPVVSPKTEAVPIVEVGEEMEKGDIPLEAREYLEKVDKEDLALHRAVVHKGQTVLEPAGGVGQPSVVLPMSKAGVLVGIKKKVSVSARWLAEWCVRIIKKMQGRVMYSPENTAG